MVSARNFQQGQRKLGRWDRTPVDNFEKCFQCRLGNIKLAADLPEIFLGDAVTDDYVATGGTIRDDDVRRGGGRTWFRRRQTFFG